MSLHNRGSIEPYMPDSIRFYEHQVDGIRRMAVMRSVLLADEMGLGKSLQTLAVFCIDVHMGRLNTMIVVCPASLKVNWLEEVGKFTTIHAEVLAGTPTKRRAQIATFRALTGPKILIVNYEQVEAHLEELNSIRFGIATFDEAHYMKNPKAKRTKACMSLLSTRSMMLTGSPLLNHVNELWTLLNRIAPGEFGTYYGFVNEYCVFGGFENKQIVGVKNEKRLNLKLQEVMVRRLKKDVLDLPDVQYVTKLVELHPRQRKYYNEVYEDMKLSVSNSETVDIGNALTKFLRLKQICGTTAAVLESGDDHSFKLDVAAEDARQILDSGHRVVAFTQFRDIQAAYAKRIRGAGVTASDYPIYILNGDTPSEPDGRSAADPKKKLSRQEVVHQWANNPKPGIIIAMFQVAGVGLNMTAARHGQFLDKLFVPGLNAQAVDRMHRIGASESQPVQILEYLCQGTVEDRVEKILRTKKKVFDNIIERDNWTSAVLLEALKEDVA